MPEFNHVRSAVSTPSVAGATGTPHIAPTRSAGPEPIRGSPLSATPQTEQLPRAFGKYELLEQLGQGGMGIVYKAREPGVGRLVALKMIRPGSLTSAAVERFRREAQATGRFDHFGIVPLYELGEQDGCPFFTMPHVEGRNLREWVERDGLPPLAEAVQVVRALAEAVAHAHQRGVIHRDLKPANVMLDSDRRPRILDFGLARCLSEESSLTRPGMPIGTPEYMAPEQALGESSQIGAATDVYALGAILYYLLTGRAPVSGTSLPDLLLKLTDPDSPAPPPSLVRPDVPEGLEDVCLRCLRKDPRCRYQSAAELAAALAAPPRSTTVAALAQAPPLVRPTPRRPRRVPRPLLAGLAVLAGLAGLLALWFALRPASQTSAASADLNEVNPLDPPPQALRRDFALDVRLLTATGRQAIAAEGGVHTVKADQELILEIVPARDCYLRVLDVNEHGVPVQLFPCTEAEAKTLFKAGERRILPGEDYVITPQRASKPEHLYIAASSIRWPSIAAGPRQGRYPVLEIGPTRSMVRQQKASSQAADGFSETIVRYWVR